MTTGDLLLQWLTHMREGPWASFRRALVAFGSNDDDDPVRAANRLQSYLSEMAHAQFFFDDRGQWRVFAPLVGGLHDASEAVLCGGRTPRLVDQLVCACEAVGCSVSAVSTSYMPGSIHLTGPPAALADAARGAGLTYVPNLAGALSATLKPIQAVVRSAEFCTPPINWSVRSFDLETLRWVDDLLPRTAYEYKSRHGDLRHYVYGGPRGLRPIGRRESVYAAAHIHQLPLVSYDKEMRMLFVPVGAPLPDGMTRTAAACSGAPGSLEDGRLVYRDVPSVIAGALLAAAGQRPPDPHWVPEEGRARR